MMTRQSTISPARPPAGPLALVLAALTGCPSAPPGDASATDASSGTATTTTGATTTPTTGDMESTSSGGEETPAHGPLKAGVAMGYLTGPVGASMAGYGGRAVTNNTPWNEVLNGAAGFFGYGTAKAIALEVEGERLVILKMPTMSAEHSLTEGTIAKLKELHGIDLTGRLITGATHSHHNIARYWRLPAALGFVGADAPDEEIIDRMTTTLAGVVAAAIADLGPAQWGVTWQDDWDADNQVYRDRRGENNPTYGKDPRLTVLAVRRPGGAPMAAILNFGMHGTVWGEDNELFTEDAAGGLEMKFEEAFFAANGAPIFGMFMQSGGGDASPAGDALGHPEPARIERIGHVAAPKLLAAYETIAWKDEASLAVRSHRIDLTYSGIGYDDYPEFLNANGKPYTWGAWQCLGGDLVDDNNPATSMEGKPKNCTAIEGLLKGLGASIPNGEVHQTYLTVAALDDFYLVTLPGEPAASVVGYARASLADRGVGGMVVGYSQDHLLYLTQPDDWLQGGYESEMSLWGPLFAKYLVDRQMELVDALRAGELSPVWWEDSPSLSVGTAFTPRALEAGAEPPGVTIEAPPEIGRGQTLRFGWTGGDPALGEPLVVVQFDDGGGFVDVPAPSGWPGRALDNTRYHMLTHYAPDPKPNGKILPARSHRWYVDWQVPADMPAGAYRLRVTGRAHDGQATADYAIESAPFLVAITKDIAVTAQLAGGALTLSMTMSAPPYEVEKVWPIGGYRLLDPEVGPADTITIRAPLRVSFTKDGAPVGETYEVPWTPGEGHVLDFASTGLDPQGLVALVGLMDDVVPNPIEAPVEAL